MKFYEILQKLLNVLEIPEISPSAVKFVISQYWQTLKFGNSNYLKQKCCHFTNYEINIFSIFENRNIYSNKKSHLVILILY